MTQRTPRSSGTPAYTLDAIDRSLIAALQINGRRSFTSLAQELGLSVTAIRNRVQRLESTRMLQVVGITNPYKVGFDMLALVGLKARASTIDEVLESCRTMAEASWVAATAGSFDVFLELVCRDAHHFRDVLRQVQHLSGVETTETFFILDVLKLDYGWGVGNANPFPPEISGAE